MTTYYFLPLPQIPDDLLLYCERHQYPLSLKKKYIVAQLINLNTETDIDELLAKTSWYCSSISKSSVYLVLQWMIAHDIVTKKITGDSLRVQYKTNFSKLSALSLHYADRSKGTLSANA